MLPSAIDFNYVFAHASFVDNPTLYAVVISSVALYIILCVLCRYLDVKDSRKLGISLLPDNQPTQSYCYELIVFTGTRYESGTDSKIRFILAGDQEDTGVRVLGDTRRKNFRRGGIDSFIMTVDRYKQLFCFYTSNTSIS